MANKLIKRLSTSIVLRELQTNTYIHIHTHAPAMRYNVTQPLDGYKQADIQYKVLARMWKNLIPHTLVMEM